MTHPPLRVGLTGGIGSGKSLVAGVLRDLGAAVLDADQIAREVVAPGGPAYADVVREFGPGVLAPDGTVDRKALAARVFADPRARLRLNGLTHPHILRRLAEDAARLDATPGVDVIVFEIPLLLDVTDGRDLGLAGIVVVFAPEEARLDRIVARDGLLREDARRRLDAQVPLQDKVARADWVIDNGGSRDATRAQVEQVWRRWPHRQR